MSKSFTFTREHLYELVWSQPISRIGPKFGVSDTAITKICKKLDVPRPPRGHWARLAHGYAVDQSPLPNLKKGAVAVYELSPSARRNRDLVMTDRPMPTVTVKSHVSRYHAITAELRSELIDGWQNRYGRIRSKYGISVSKASLSRASRMLDALIRALEKRGISTTIDDRGLRCWVEGEGIRLELHEPAKRQTPKKQSEYGYPRWEYVPTGNLALTLFSKYLSSCRTSWADTKIRCLEERLGDVVAVFEIAPEIIITAQNEEHRERLAWEREQLCERRRSDLYRHAQTRAKQLNELAENLKKAQTIRDFINTVECAPSAPISTKRLARWASLYADHLDPLVDFELSKLETKSPVNQLVPGSIPGQGARFR